MGRRALLIVLLVAAAAVMAWLAVYQVDDAYIVYRYARSLAQGNGFTFNPGERVEGVTCFLWTLALAPVHAAGLPLPRIAPVLTALFGLGCLVLVARRRPEGDALAVLLLATSGPFAYWSVGALETVPFAFVLTLAAMAYARERIAGRGVHSAIALGVASLLRPETPLVVLAIAADRFLSRTGRPLRERAVDLARWTAVLAAFVLPFLAFRRLYFDDWLPNTYYAKAGAPVSVLLSNGWVYARACLAGLIRVPGIPAAAAWIPGACAVAATLAYAARRPALRAETLVAGAVLLASVLEGGDWMVLSRFWVPALPALAILASAALRDLARRGGVRRAVAVALGFAVAASGIAGAVRARNGGHGLVVNAEGYRHAHLRIGRYLEERARPGDAVALMDVGMIGWEAKSLRVIDTTGLTDREIAHAPGGFLEKEYPVAALLARDPRFVVLVPGGYADDRIHDDPAFTLRYRELFSVNHRFNWVPPSRYVLHVYERKERSASRNDGSGANVSVP